VSEAQAAGSQDAYILFYKRRPPPAAIQGPPVPVAPPQLLPSLLSLQLDALTEDSLD
jgi:hypothetical protein